eukprot:5488987-Lingulodinium_polyedra.AAC.1
MLETPEHWCHHAKKRRLQPAKKLGPWPCSSSPSNVLSSLAASPNFPTLAQERPIHGGQQ